MAKRPFASDVPRKSVTHAKTTRTPGMGHGHGGPNGKKTVENMTAFLAVLAMPTGSVRKACIAIGIDRRTAYYWKEGDEEFRKGWDDACEEGVDGLEEEARRRGYKGVERAIYHQGEVVGHQTEYSDTMLKLVLQGRRNAVFGNKTEVTGAGGGAIQHNVLVEFVKSDKK